jgi:hypothetical protein
MKLASVERITSLTPIEGADSIVTAQLLGWNIVVKKDEFQVGQLVSYIQIDTVTPEKEEFEFLRPRNFRVRSIKLRGQISQGLIVPLSEGKWKEGDDLTEVLGIKKYSKDKEVSESRPKMPKVWYKKLWYKLKYNVLVKLFPWAKVVNRNGFPKDVVSITDEERIQNIPRVLDTYKGKMFVAAEKLDGSSITIIHEKKWNKSKYRLCSRRFELFNTDNEWYRVFVDTNFKQYIDLLAKHFNTNNVVVQGEYIGKPQGNKYRLTQNEIRLFNIQINGKRLTQDTFYQICTQYNIPCCPLLGQFELNHTLPELLKYAEGKSKLNSSTEREGVVLRCVEDNLSFKVISNKFLLKNDE